MNDVHDSKSRSSFLTGLPLEAKFKFGDLGSFLTPSAVVDAGLVVAEDFVHGVS